VVKWINVINHIKGDQEMLKAFIKFYVRLNSAEWEKPNDIFITFNSADLIKCKKKNRIVFNVGGNKYRLICRYYFGIKYIQLFVKFVGKHSEYDLIDVCKIEMFKK